MKKRSVLIDLDRLKDPNNGLGQVALFFGEQIGKIDDDQLEFTLLVPGEFVGRFGNKVRYETIGPVRRHLPWFCKKYDLWYTIHQDSWYFPSSAKTPYIITINDLNFLGEKSPAKAKSRLKRLQKKVDRASAVTTISKYTKSVVQEHLHTGNIPVEVIYCGVTVNTFPEVERPAYMPEGKILFSVGVVQPKKNYDVLIDFMQKMPEDYVLVIAGNKAGEHSGELEKRIGDLKLEHRILLPGLISDEDKYWLYTHCQAVLFPSKFEGMGFPPVEAMRCGKPVFASTYSSIPEVSEDKAYYWENFDPDYMVSVFTEKMKLFESSPGLPEKLRQHSMRYTWEHNVEEYLRLFKRILQI